MKQKHPQEVIDGITMDTTIGKSITESRARVEEESEKVKKILEEMATPVARDKNQ